MVIRKEQDAMRKDETYGGNRNQKKLVMDIQAQERISKGEKARRKKEQTQKMNDIETTNRFGLFCLTFMYFRTFSRVKSERMALLKDVTVTSPTRNDEMALLSAEGRKMLLEEQNFIARQEAYKKAMSRAAAGEKRIYDKEKRVQEKKVSAVIIFF
mmetsp:Transcript_42680/g.100151  ORF Transcript_42680/g.100151 Transcript_42680/m.100151 type:complete len:156 (+) Transcript_42680:4060-4527(+)|eukprot:CAMPEP_0113303388 /NCGR_PEP_ID=MMETSP0010_2-20120614/3826_1 /TAXON_ID=216773 ORGANISM="Corethron hystrix, Strain 308" /NCGR_SAMPLE_ID=MMETSP0010_2 /ASSEMBLY_ACC=CAM_ASM_000155 /LENGTH=155 /DNA_ID=CAMNT_0000157379 /DNA_START=1018 /DNA_END=1485 /DNA_ORIENTATION=+ /assembly_acc=CAM_ASM_000155